MSGLFSKTMIDLIAWGVLVASLAAIAVIVARKFPRLRLLDTRSTLGDRNAQVKGDLLARRLQRKFHVASMWTKEHAQPALQKVGGGYRRMVKRVETLEEEYRQRSHRLRAGTDADTLQKIGLLLEEAETFLKEGELEEAEKKYIEIVALAPESVEAFVGLGAVYTEKKDLAHAAESLLYAIKLTPDDAHLHRALAETYRAANDLSKALASLQQAVVLEPNDPKNLDALLEVCLATKQRALAERTLQQLRTANPDNQKLGEFADQIKAMPVVDPKANP